MQQDLESIINSFNKDVVGSHRDDDMYYIFSDGEICVMHNGRSNNQLCTYMHFNGEKSFICGPIKNSETLGLKFKCNNGDGLTFSKVSLKNAIEFRHSIIYYIGLNSNM